MTPKQTKFLTELFQCSTITEASEKAGITYVTARKWIHTDEQFQKALQETKKEMLSGVSIQMQLGLSDAVQKLLEIIQKEDTSDQVRINAIDTLFRNSRIITEQVDIMERLERLEKIQEAIDNETNTFKTA